MVRPPKVNRASSLFAAVTAAAVTTTAVAPVAAAATAITAIAAATPATAAEATAAATTATAAVATPATTTAAEAATRRTLLARTRDVDRQGAALHLVAVELLHAFLRLIGAAHRHEGKTTGTTRKLVEDDLNDADGTDLAEQGLEVLGGAGEGKIPHVELGVF
jgi:hypothetical protein